MPSFLKFRFQSFFKIVKWMNEKRPEAEAQDFLRITILITAILLAVTIRLQNFRWGFYLSEFDPYWHYRSADYIVRNGIEAFIAWRDYMSWIPGGRPVAASTPIGLPLFAASLYGLLNLLGVKFDLMSLTILIPPLSGGLAALAVYFLGEELGSNEVGLISAILIAFNGSHIERTHLGFFKHETLGIPLITISLLFFLKSVKAKNETRAWINSVLAGLSLGYLAITWTGYVYSVGLIALLTIALSILGLAHSSRLLLSFSVTQGIYLAIASMFPRSQSEILSLNLAISLAAFIFIIARRELDRLESLKLKMSALVGIFALTMFLGSIGIQSGFLSSLYGKLMAILNPSLRAEQAIIESVAEHKVTNWFNLFNDHGPLLFLFGFSLLISITKLDVNNVTILLSGLTSLYFSTMMVRLSLIFSPFSSIIGAIGAYQLVDKASEASETVFLSKRRKKRREEMAPVASVFLATLIVFGTLVPSILQLSIRGNTAIVFTHVGAPVTIAAASLPISVDVPDWPETLAWIRENTPSRSVFMSWWDYGYWITTLADRPTIIDNATINTTQVALIGKAFISNNTIALPIMKKFNVSYVVVFTSLPHATYIGGWGDEVKWIWMAEIGYGLKTEPTHNNTLQLFADRELSKALADQNLLPKYSGTNQPSIILPKRDYVLTKLLVLSSFGTQQSLIQPDPHYSLVYRSTYGLVSVFKVSYDYQGPSLFPISAQSTDTTTSTWKWESDYLFAAGRLINFTMLDIKRSVGSYRLNETEGLLNASLFVELIDQDGEVVFSHEPMLGNNAIWVYRDKIVYRSGNYSNEFGFTYEKPIKLSFRVHVDRAEDIGGELLEPAKVEILIGSINIGWLSDR